VLVTHGAFVTFVGVCVFRERTSY